MNDQTLWAMAQLYMARDLPVPIDLLAEADSRGLLLTEFDQPRYPEGEDNGNFAKEELHDPADNTGLCLLDCT